MRTLSDRGYGVSTGHLMYPDKASHGGTNLKSIESQQNHKTTQAVAKSNVCSPQTDSGAPLPRITTM